MRLLHRLQSPGPRRPRIRCRSPRRDRAALKGEIFDDFHFIFIFDSVFVLICLGYGGLFRCTRMRRRAGSETGNGVGRRGEGDEGDRARGFISPGLKKCSIFILMISLFVP